MFIRWNSSILVGVFFFKLLLGKPKTILQKHVNFMIKNIVSIPHLIKFFFDWNETLKCICINRNRLISLNIGSHFCINIFFVFFFFFWIYSSETNFLGKIFFFHSIWCITFRTLLNHQSIYFRLCRMISTCSFYSQLHFSWE